MNLKEYSKILNDTLEKIEKETGQKFDNNVEVLAIHKYLSTPAMKSAYPDILLFNDKITNNLILEYNVSNYYKFYGKMHRDVFEFRSTNKFFHLRDDKGIISESVQLSALKMKDLLKPESTFDQFLNNIKFEDIDNMIATCNKADSNFFKVIKLIKSEEPFSREFLTSSLKVLSRSHNGEHSIENHLEDKCYAMIKAGIPEGEDGLSYLRRLLSIEDMNATNYGFEELDAEYQADFNRKIINENLPKNSISYLMLNNSENFIYNIFNEIIFPEIKKELSFKMKLISHDLTIEQLYKQHPVIDIVFNEAMKQDNNLNQLPENLFKQIIVKDKDIYDEDIGVMYYNYIDHIVDDFEREKVMQEHFKTRPFKTSYNIVDPELDIDVIRFIGTTGPEVTYMLCSSIDKNEDVKHKVLNLDTYLLTKKVTLPEFEDAVKKVIDYCKENEYILCIDYQSMQNGLNFDEADIVCNTVDKFKNEICAVMLPSEKGRLSLISNLDIPYKDIVLNENKITDMMASKVSTEGITKTLQSSSKPMKLKM